MPSERSAPRAVLFLLAATCSFAGLGAAQSFPGEIVYQGLPIDQGPVSAGNRVFFTTREGQYPFLKYRLHVTDGTLGSTHGIVALCPAGCGVPLRLLALPNGVVLVLEHLPSNGNKTLWRSDGTESGTWPLLVDRYSVTLLGKVRARALVFEYQGSGSNRTYWSTDGETLEVLPLPAPLPTPGLYDPLIEDGDVGYLVPQSGGLEGVIISNGTPSGTRISAALPSSSSIEVPLAGALLSASWQPGLPILSRVDAVDASVSFFRIPTSLTSAWIGIF